MAKHKRRAEAAVSEKDTAKKKNQAVKKSKTAPKTRGIKDKVTRAKTIAKAVKPRGQASKNARKPSDGKKSKYFSEPLKEEPEDIFEDSSLSLPESSVLKSNDSNIKEEKKENDNTSEESDEDEDWEEVEELAGPLGPAEEADQEPAVPSQPVEIEIETAEARLKRQKKENKQAEFEMYLRRAMKRFTKEIQMDTHKVHLLCLLASGLFRNRLCCEPDLLAITLSLVPPHFTTVYKKRINTVYLEDLLKWFKETFTLNPALPEEKDVRLEELLERRLGSLSARDHQEMTYLFLLVLRSLRLYCRLVLSLQPISFKPTTKTGKAKTSRSPPSKDKSNKADKKPPEPKISLGSKRPSSSAEGQPKKGGKRQKRNVEDREVKKKEVDGQRPKNTRRRSTASKVSYKEESSDGDEELSDDEEFQPTSEEDSDDLVDAKKSKGKEKGKSQASRRSSKTKKKTRRDEEEEKEDEEEEEDYDDEEEDELVCKKQWRRKRQGKGNDEWIEVYLKEAKKWICIGVDQGVDHPKLCSNQATQPITYVVGIDDNGYLKDVSSRYDPTWLTSSRKRRIDSEWWKETLGFFECPDSKQKQKEDKELQETLMNKPLPTSISEYKNHPLYALERHMLKYEALYPTTATILGYCRGEPVYSRDCVHTLHSRDIWLKQARTVRLGEEPYKMVKGSSNRSRKARMMSENKENKDLALFGHWQTEEYQPPVAINGKIPRNDFGNVYMFQPCMLPVGCVHLHLPNLNRVARKLNLDCAPAVTGFDFHGGYSHAVIDGYIVCEEHEEILKAAWENEQEIQKRKEKEKREKRALANWTLLVKGLLIKQRLQRRYGQQGVAKDTGITQKREGEADGFSSGEEGEGEAHTAAPSLAISWPQNRQEDQDEGGAKKSVSKRERRGQQKHLFPFEKSV